MQKGATAFKPFEWQIVLEGVVDVNQLWTQENGVVDPDVRDGTNRTTTHAALQQACVEIHLAEHLGQLRLHLGQDRPAALQQRLPEPDLLRHQPGRPLLRQSANGNRYQCNLLYFYQAEKDTNSASSTPSTCATSRSRSRNLYMQDFLVARLARRSSASTPTRRREGRRARLRPARASWCAPIRSASRAPHDLDAFYLGWASEGHIGWLNVSHAFYEALGTTRSNPIAGRKVDINAQLAFLELSMDRDWMRYQASVFFTSGDGNPRDGSATGFDTILDIPQIMGGEFSYWNRQSDPHRRPRRRRADAAQQHRSRSAQQQDPGPGELRQPGPADGRTSGPLPI